MKILLSFLLISLSMLCVGQELDCSEFKNGKFLLLDEEIGNSIIERKDDTQIEFHQESGLKIALEVTWLSNCSYRLDFKEVLENPNDLPTPEDMIVTVEIIEIKENSYIQRSTTNLFDLVLESELVKLD